MGGEKKRKTVGARVVWWYSDCGQKKKTLSIVNQNLTRAKYLRCLNASFPGLNYNLLRILEHILLSKLKLLSCRWKISCIKSEFSFAPGVAFLGFADISFVGCEAHFAHEREMVGWEIAVGAADQLLQILVLRAEEADPDETRIGMSCKCTTSS